MQTGDLLLYRDATRDGTGDVHTPEIIARGHWDQHKFVFSGGNGVVYFVNKEGYLHFYKPGVIGPTAIGRGGWQNFKFLFAGENGMIYAVDEDGHLFLYRDETQDGTGDLANPTLKGWGGWQNFKSVFGEADGIIYARTEQDGLLFYRDKGHGDVQDPSLVFLNSNHSWEGSKFIFSGGPYIGGPIAGTGGAYVLYSVDESGQLWFHLFDIYLDDPQRERPIRRQSSRIGLGGWQAFKFLCHGGGGIIYAVVA
jgi:hypothetical protein